MTERRRTAIQERARLELMREADKARKFLGYQKLREGLIPPDWDQESEDIEAKHAQIRITLSVDEDVAKWYRRMGKGYQAHVNNVLRMFMLNVIAKEREGYYDRSFLEGKPI